MRGRKDRTRGFDYIIFYRTFRKIKTAREALKDILPGQEEDNDGSRIALKEVFGLTRTPSIKQIWFKQISTDHHNNVKKTKMRHMLQM